jgi:hypothetical protein
MIVNVSKDIPTRSGSQKGQGASCCVHGNETSGCIKRREFVTSWGTVSFSKRTLPMALVMVWCNLNVRTCIIQGVFKNSGYEDI